MKNMILAVISLFTIISCEGSGSSVPPLNQSSDSFVFGHFYGQCQGEKCIETFKLEDGKLYEDTIDDYSHQRFNFEKLDNNQYNKVKKLLSQIPVELLQQKEGNIGCPDCSDGGGLFLQYFHNGIKKTWKIDKNLQYVPKNLHSFVKTINSTIASINTHPDSSSNPKTLVDVKSLTFGHFYGMCQGESCIETYKLTEDVLFEDIKDDYNHETFDFQKLPKEKFDKVKSLLNQIPVELLKKDSTIGCPDCADSGGLYIEFEYKGKLRSWTIDKTAQNLPANIQTFVNTLTQSISNINETSTDTSSENNYLIFGDFYGRCIGEKCLTTYKLTNDTLFEDIIDDRNHNSFEFIETGRYKYGIVQDLMSTVPYDILSKNNEVIGCPDCADQGGIYIEYSKDGTIRKYRIDNNLNNIPLELQNFVKNIQEKLSDLKSSKDMKCPLHFDPICVKEEVNGEIIFNTYSNSCIMNHTLQGKLISKKKGICE